MADDIKKLKALVELDRILTKGIRQETLKQLVRLNYWIGERIPQVFEELCERLGETHLKPLKISYVQLARRDEEELEAVKRFLGVSKRTAIDYLTALERIYAF